MLNQIAKFTALVGISVVLAGCKPDIVETKKPSATPTISQNTLWIMKDNTLQQVSTLQSQPNVVVNVPKDLLPASFELNKTLQVSDDNAYVVWFVPSKGMVRLNTKTQAVDIFYEPTAWFYENPYFMFLGKTHDLLLVDKKGTEVVKINLDTKIQANTAIPYPFGTIFRVSPDKDKILYIEGYRQSTDRPSYLITDLSGKEINRIKTNAEVADRSLVGWTADSTQIVTIENGRNIVAYSIIEPSQKATLYSLPENDRVLELFQYDTNLFIGSRSYWYLFDTKTNKLKYRMPLEAISQLTKPRYVHTNTNDTFLVEETVTAGDGVYKRLWQSNWMGSQTIIIPKYGVLFSQNISY